MAGPAVVAGSPSVVTNSSSLPAASTASLMSTPLSQSIQSDVSGVKEKDGNSAVSSGSPTVTPSSVTPERESPNPSSSAGGEQPSSAQLANEGSADEQLPADGLGRLAPSERGLSEEYSHQLAEVQQEFQRRYNSLQVPFIAWIEKGVALL